MNERHCRRANAEFHSIELDGNLVAPSQTKSVRGLVCRRVKTWSKTWFKQVLNKFDLMEFSPNVM